jgi:hypothetical protein
MASWLQCNQSRTRPHESRQIHGVKLFLWYEMKKGNNYHFKIEPLQVLRYVIAETDKEAWFLQFFEDLCKDDADMAVIPYAAQIIREANGFREQARINGRKRTAKQATEP